jgi:predicted DNA-binding transcriptional regulator AlpA
MDRDMLAKTTPKKKRAKRLQNPRQKPWLQQASLRARVQQEAERIRAQGSPRLIDRVEVQAVVGHSYPTIWHWMQTGKFPRSRVAGGKSMWLESEVIAWMNSLPLRKLKGDRT